MMFKRNMHLAKKYGKQKIDFAILQYPKQYNTPKYLLFMKEMADNGWKVKLYVARVSKYVFLIKGEDVIKIRFSNHRPLLYKEEENDCDYYVGVSNKQITTTEELTKKLLKKE